MKVGQGGFRVVGDWGEIVEHAERLTSALDRAFVEEERERFEEAFEQWRGWRPRPGEVVEEVRDRTAEEASLDEADVEEEANGVREDLHEAREHLEEKLGETEGVPEAAEAVKGAAEKASRSARSASRQAWRALEESVYRHVMTRVSPYYFDNALVSASLERLGEASFAFEVKVKEDALEDRVVARLEEE